MHTNILISIVVLSSFKSWNNLKSSYISPERFQTFTRFIDVFYRDGPRGESEEVVALEGEGGYFDIES